MTQTKIEIEEHQFDRWVATVEGGTGMDVRRALVRATSFDDVILAVVEAHAGMRPPAVKVRVFAEHDAPGGWRASLPDAPALSVQDRTRDELIAEGEAMGLTIDRRWGEYRLREVVEGERVRRAVQA